MITGYNHNVRHNGRIYHIQTEDSGIQYAHIITHLFVGGNIISSKKSSYDHLVGKISDEDEMEKEIRALMKEQHKEMMRGLKAGEYDHIGSFKKEGEALTPGAEGQVKVRNVVAEGPKVGGIGGLPGMTAAAAEMEENFNLSSDGDEFADLERSIEAILSDVDSLLDSEETESTSTKTPTPQQRPARESRMRSSRLGRERPSLQQDRIGFSAPPNAATSTSSAGDLTAVEWTPSRPMPNRPTAPLPRPSSSTIPRPSSTRNQTLTSVPSFSPPQATREANPLPLARLIAETLTLAESRADASFTLSALPPFRAAKTEHRETFSGSFARQQIETLCASAPKNTALQQTFLSYLQGKPPS
jgi:hypothetical protein